MKKIFIAGCGRSGTTLTRTLMGNFAGTVAHPVEASIDQFGKFDRNVSAAVVKRTWRCHRTLHRLPQDIGLIYCVRHPFDVLTSVHPGTASQRRFHISRERWVAEYMALGKFRRVNPDRPVLFSRYEDLVAGPDAAQQRIAGFFGLTPVKRFSEAGIHDGSVGKWKRQGDLRLYIRSLPRDFVVLLQEFCSEFGYDGSIPP